MSMVRNGPKYKMLGGKKYRVKKHMFEVKMKGKVSKMKSVNYFVRNGKRYIIKFGKKYLVSYRYIRYRVRIHGKYIDRSFKRLYLLRDGKKYTYK